MKKSLIYILFAREPIPGTVKSRLAAQIGNEPASRVYEALLKDTVSALCAAGDPFAIAHTPESTPRYFSAFARNALECFPQEGENLGKRMERTFDKCFAVGYEKVVIVGSDIPFLSTEILREASSKLEDNDVVIGPCSDGGYYLIGLSQPTPELFKHISWGDQKVLGQTLDIIQQQGYRIYMLPELFDIDRFDDLQNLARGLVMLKNNGLSVPAYIEAEIDTLFTVAK